MKILIAVLLVFFIYLLYANLTFRIRYRDDPQTKSEWFDRGYKVGVESGKQQAFINSVIECNN